MKRSTGFLSALLLLASAVFFSSCSTKTVSSDEAVKNILSDKTPAMLINVQIKNILDKGGISNFENIPLLARPLIGDKLNFFQGATTTGLDLGKKTYILAYPQGIVEPELVLLASVADQEKLKTFLSEQLEMEAQEHNGFSFVNDGTLFAWNDKLLIMTTRQGEEAAVLERVEGLFETALKEGKRIPKAFSDILADKNTDFSIGISLEQSMQMSDEQETSKEMSDMLKDCYQVYNTSFLPGKIETIGKNYYTDRARDNLNFFGKEGLPESYSGFMGLSNPYMAGGMNLDFANYYEKVMSLIPETVRIELRETLGMDIVTDPQLKQMVGGIGGHFMVTVSKGEKSVIAENENSRFLNYMPTLIVVGQLKGTVLKMLMDSVLSSSVSGNDGLYRIYEGENPGEKAYLYFTTGDEFIFTNNLQVIETLKKDGKLPKVDGELIANLYKYPVAGYIDFNAIHGELNGLDKKWGTYVKEFKAITFSGDMDSFKLEMVFNRNDKNGLWLLLNTVKESASELATGWLF